MIIKKKNRLLRTVSLMLVFCMALSGCGGGTPSGGKTSSKLINKVQVELPNPTGPEAIVGLQANIAIQYYVEARMYLEKLSMQDASADPDGFKKLVSDAVTAFENAEKISESLSGSVDKWMEAEDSREQPKIKVIQTADANRSRLLFGMFGVKAYADGKSASELTAQEIVDAFDKAKSGQKIKTLAELLGTDAKHAYAELKIAQATLEGADATKIAEQATNCIKVAKTLKTAGTVAGLVIAAAPVATGAVATMATGELIAAGGGIVMGAANTCLEMTSTGAMLYYGTDENKVTELADKAADSKFMKTANLVVGLAGVGYNIKNQISDINKLLDQAKDPNALDKLFTSLSTNNGKEASNLFGILSFGLGNIDPEEGTLLGIKMEPHSGKTAISILDTMIGTSPEQQEAMATVLKDSGYPKEAAEKAVEEAVKIMESGKKPEETPDEAADLPADFVENKLKENEAIAPGSTYIDLDDFIDGMETFMEVISKKTEPGKSETAASGYEWVEPYSYFGVENIVELYKALREVHPAKIELTPVACRDNNDGDEIDFTNKDTFVIDMSEGATSVYQTSYMDGDDSSGRVFNVTYTFTGDPSDDGKYGTLMTLAATGTITWRQDGKLYEEINEPDCAIYVTNVPKRGSVKDIRFGNGTVYTVYFRIDRVYIEHK